MLERRVAGADNIKRKIAIDAALAALGEGTKNATLLNLKKMGVIRDENHYPQLDILETGLATIFGEGSLIIMELAYVELERLEKQ